MSTERRELQPYHASLMEPWDGPASVVFTDGTLFGVVLDLQRPPAVRYWVTDDGLVVMASEARLARTSTSRVHGRL